MVLPHYQCFLPLCLVRPVNAHLWNVFIYTSTVTLYMCTFIYFQLLNLCQQRSVQDDNNLLCSCSVKGAAALPSDSSPCPVWPAAVWKGRLGGSCGAGACVGMWGRGALAGVWAGVEFSLVPLLSAVPCGSTLLKIVYQRVLSYQHHD